jgi:hypothetical protein
VPQGKFPRTFLEHRVERAVVELKSMSSHGFGLVLAGYDHSGLVQACSGRWFRARL